MSGDRHALSRADIALRGEVVPVGHTLRVGSFNLLNRHENLAARLERLVAEVQRLDLDVLCLQEVLANGELDVAAYFAERTALTHAHAAKPKVKANGDQHGTLILARSRFTKRSEEHYHPVFTRGVTLIPATHVALTHNGRQVHVFDAHLAWGSTAEPLRMQQAEILVAKADAIRREDPTAVILLAGDFNAVEQSSTVRFLTGLQSSDRGLGTLWVDAWRMWGTDSNWATSIADTYWGARTGAGKDLLHPELIPARRIDYLLSYDWVYGKAGSPLSFVRFADQLTGDQREISDHFGVASDIWVPPLKGVD